MSDPEEALAFQLRAVGITFHREHVFAPPRKWRADFLIVDARHTATLLVEIDGGSWVGGRHTSGTGFAEDCEKHNAAVLAGYRILRFTPAMVDSGEAVNVIERAIR